jgi:hypothetical protein
LKDSTDISFDFLEKKQGKRVVGITFQIHKNAQDRLVVETQTASKTTKTVENAETVKDTTFFTDTFFVVKLWGVSETRLRQLITEFGEERVAAGLAYTRDGIENGKIKGNPAGFFCKAVEEAWQSPTQTKEKQIEQVKEDKALKRSNLLAEETIWKTRLDDLLEIRRQEASEIVRKLTQEDALLAGEAVNNIMKDRIMCNILERKTGLQLDSLSMNYWRHNADLRDAVLMKIESMFPDDFVHIQKQYDAAIKQARKKLSDIQALL